MYSCLFKYLSPKIIITTNTSHFSDKCCFSSVKVSEHRYWFLEMVPTHRYYGPKKVMSKLKSHSVFSEETNWTTATNLKFLLQLCFTNENGDALTRSFTVSEITAGVFQDSILGPILFVISTNYVNISDFTNLARFLPFFLSFIHML